MAADPYQAYDRVFVIIRLEAAPTQQPATTASVIVLKALWSEAAAEAEVQRLNQGAQDGAQYVWKAARLERRQPQPALT